jgi:hypothetical protein
MTKCPVERDLLPEGISARDQRGYYSSRITAVPTPCARIERTRWLGRRSFAMKEKIQSDYFVFNVTRRYSEANTSVPVCYTRTMKKNIASSYSSITVGDNIAFILFASIITCSPADEAVP